MLHHGYAMGRLEGLSDAGYRHRQLNGPSVVWELGHSVGILSSIVAIVGVCVIVSTGRLGILPPLSRFVPTGLKSYFEREAAVEQPPDLAKAAAAVLKRLAPEQSARTRAAEGFGIGDSEESVLRLEGQPSRKLGNVWHYGDSSVTFVGGHVVSWSNSSARPLRIRQ
jgi:hypothetical protein